MRLRPFAFVALLAFPSALLAAPPVSKKPVQTKRMVHTATSHLPVFAAPAGQEYARVVPDGVTILPNGRFLTPKGARLYTGEDLWNVVLSPNGKIAVGFSDEVLTIYPLTDTLSPRLVPHVIRTKNLAPTGVFTKDSGLLVVSNGEGGGIDFYETAEWMMTAKADDGKRYALRDQKPLFTLSANENGVGDSYINDIVLSPDEKFVYGVDIANQRLVVFDITGKKLLATSQAGREPYALTLSEDGKSAFVANIGLFDYSIVPSPKAGSAGDKRGLAIPAFGFPSREAERGVEREGRDGARSRKPVRSRCPEHLEIHGCESSPTDSRSEGEVRLADSCGGGWRKIGGRQRTQQTATVESLSFCQQCEQRYRANFRCGDIEVHHLHQTVPLAIGG